jgi:hypothetical protein
MCRPEPLAALIREAGLDEVVSEAIHVQMEFADFDDYWLPHLLPGPAAAQRFAGSLGDRERVALRERLRSALPIGADGRIRLPTRGWAVRGTTRVA